MKITRIAAVAVVLFCSAGIPVYQAAAAQAQKEQIVGKWWAWMGAPEGDKITMEFAPNGTYSVTAAGQTSQGTYQFLDDATLETKVAGQTSKMKATVAGNSLTLVLGAEQSRFERVPGS